MADPERHATPKRRRKAETPGDGPDHAARRTEDGADHAERRPEDGDPPADDTGTSLVGRVTHVVEGAVEGAADRVGGAADRVGGVVGDAADRVGGVVGGALNVAVGGAVTVARTAVHQWEERPGARVRRVRRMAREPLPYLYAEQPEARRASPRELGIKTIDVDQIAGTAVGGVTQRGGDFLPLKPFRSRNWHGRWQRIVAALERLAILPPIDVVLSGGRYWVLDGHNRVGAALYGGQVGIDANVVELVPPNAQPSERPARLAAVLTGSRAVRTAGAGHKVGAIGDEDRIDESTDGS